MCVSVGLLLAACDWFGPAAVISENKCGSSFDVVDGNDQRGTVGQPLSKQLVVQTRVTAGNAQCSPGPDSDEPIRWVATSGNGSVSPTSSTTNAAGEARATWTVGSQLGTQTVRANWLDPVTGTVRVSQSFSATAYSPPYRVLRKASGDAQSAAPGTLLPLQPTVALLAVAEAGSLQPRIETPIQLIQVQWTVTGGGGSINPLATPTGQDGRASVAWTLGIAGTQAVRAVAPVASQDPRDTLEVVFNATVTQVPVSSITISPATGATTQVGQLTQFTARTFGGTPSTELLGRAVAWSSTNSAIATVSSQSGVSPTTIAVTAVSVGTTDIVATSEGKTATARVTVTAASAPRIAYGLVTGTTGTPAVTLTHNFEPGTITATKVSVGRYEVTFPGQATPAGKATTVLVSNYGTGVNHCKLESWRNDATALAATVTCFSRTSAADGEFSILVLGEGVLPGRFAFAHADQPTPPGPYAPPAGRVFSSSGQPITVSRSSLGTYVVSVPGLARPGGVGSEIVLATATGTSGARCGIPTDERPLGGAQIQIHCSNPAATSVEAMDSPFVFTLIERGRPGLRAGFAYNGNSYDELRGTLIPLPAGQMYNSAGGAVTQTHIDEGVYEIRFAGLGRIGADVVEHVQVTSSSDNGDYCKIQRWETTGADLVVRVYCTESDTLVPEDQDFTLLVIK
jgi:hypothetical protein